MLPDLKYKLPGPEEVPILVSVALLPFQVHLRFTFKHRSRNEAKEKQGPTPWALAYLKLVNDTNGTTVKDGYHDLLVYKVTTVLTKIH
jgi:hypothetical protein